MARALTMAVAQVSCPHCSTVLKSAQPLVLGTKVQCPRCSSKFLVSYGTPAAPSAPTGFRTGSGGPPAGNGGPVFSPQPPGPIDSLPAHPATGSARGPNRLALGLILAGSVLFVGLGAALAFICFSSDSTKEDPQKEGEQVVHNPDEAGPGPQIPKKTPEGTVPEKKPESKKPAISEETERPRPPDGEKKPQPEKPPVEEKKPEEKPPEVVEKKPIKKPESSQDKLHVLPPNATNPVITYFFHDNLAAEEKGVPDLIPTNPLGQNGFETAQVLGLRKRVYRFIGKAFPGDQQAGLTFDNRKGFLPINNYSVEMVLTFLERDGEWRRIVDVEDRQSDNGFYAHPSNQLQVYPLPGAGKRITTGEYFHVVLTVAKTGTVNAYLNGYHQFSGTTDVMVINNPRKVMHFFLDNVVGPGQYEYSNGKVALIRLYNRVLSDKQVTELAAWVQANEAKTARKTPRKDVAPDPGTLTNLANQIGKTFRFRVTGSTNGFIYGTGVYTADSSLATAAVHAGILRPGETKVIRVRIVAGRSRYIGSIRNGVHSSSWGPYSWAYTISRVVNGPKRRR